MEDLYVDILNVFITHYNKINGSNYNMFVGIEIMNDSNPMMDEFFDVIDIYNECDEYSKKLFNINEINVKDYEELYILSVEGQMICACMTIIPILMHVVQHVDWHHKIWNIVKMSNIQ